MKDLAFLVEQSRLYTSQLITDNLSDFYCYHNLQHTMEVVDYARFLCKQEAIDTKKSLLIEIAAWFHDTGFVNNYLNHEEESSKIATKFLQKHNFKEEDIQFIVECIMATELHYQKDNIYKKIMSDADCFHFGLPSFTTRTIKLKHEWEKIRNTHLTLKQMLAGSIMFLEQHEYYTKYGIDQLEAWKQENLNYIMRLEDLLDEE